MGQFALDNPDRSIHDVVVQDGVAYSANWNDGVVVVDVGGGGEGGSPTNPVKMGSFPFPTGWNHAIYPYRSESTGKFYIFAGDEAARTGRFSPQSEIGTGTPGYEGESARWRGWIHILSWDEDNEPEIVARYEVPEAGSHNIWIEDDIMYVAFYNGGFASSTSRESSSETSTARDARSAAFCRSIRRASCPTRRRSGAPSRTRGRSSSRTIIPGSGRSS